MIETVPSGTVLHGRYRIERVLGSGGFGHVYLAIDLTTSQQYAVKEYLVTGSSGQEQLKHEATVLSHLHHPNLPAFQDAFIERGRYYVVLNYIEGNDLTDLIRIARQRNEPVAVLQILHWLLAICDAVMFLHSQNPTVIHRDIKPDNIRITPNGTAILVDLGNAKAAADGARTLFFIRHQGTPGYAPPEQYPGGSGTDARSDIYALGGTLYFALTTQEPPSVSVRNQSIQQNVPTLPSLQDVLANNPPEESPEAHAARQFRLGVTKPGKPAPRHLRHVAQLGTLPPELLKQLNMVIQKSMALKPRDRYQYVADFASDLKRIAMALPVPPPSSPPPGRPIDPHSTQPDLPGIYDAIQAAREHAAQQQGAGKPQNPPDGPAPTQPMPQNSVCPRCGTQLVTKAVFCPRCGLALAGNVGNAQIAKAQGKDVSAEETLVVTPKQLKEAVATYVARPTGAPAIQSNTPKPASKPVVAGAQAQMGVVAPWNGASGNAPAGSSGGQPGTPSNSFKLSPRVILAIVILVVILVALVIFWLLTQYHSPHAKAAIETSWTDLAAFPRYSW